MAERIVIIDCDAGTDDAWALFMGLAAQRDLITPRFRIIGLTTSCGNTSIDYVTNNVTRVCDTMGDTTTPIYKGMDSFLIKPFAHVEEPPYHGEDGFGDANLPPIPTRVQPGHAVDFIIQSAQVFQGSMVMVCLGPLTNLAMAVKKEPRLRNWLKDIFILGGNIEGVGNVSGITSSAEFNFYVDPEAAQVVMDSFEGVSIYVFPWEIMLKSASTYEFRMEKLANIGTPNIELLNAIEAKILEENTDYWLAPDPLLVACVIDPSIILKTEDQRCDIELSGARTRGMMVIERNPNSLRPKNLTIILEIDQSRFESMLIWAAGGPRP